MDESRLIRTLIEFESWSSLKALASLNPVLSLSRRPLEILAHAINSQIIWLDRIEGRVVEEERWWPEPGYEQCRELAGELARRWSSFFEGLTAERLQAKISCRGSDGETFEVTLRDILLQLITHSSYHRGQAAMIVRDLGGIPSVTSYMAFSRRMSK